MFRPLRLSKEEVPYVAPDKQIDLEPEPAPDVPDSGTLYRVQVGAFESKANADEFLKKVKAAGFDSAFITEVRM